MDYNKQAEDFLKSTGSTIEIVEAVPQKKPLWTKDNHHGINYSVTLKNKKHTYTFDFWGSIADREKLDLAEEAKKILIKPSAYDVLACLNPMAEDSFEDFCAGYGYDEDSINALKTYEAVKEQDYQLRKLFSHEEMEKLSEIQ